MATNEFTLTGVLVGIAAFAYDFADRSTGERKQGTSYKAFVSENPGELAEPSAVKVTADDALALQRAGFGAKVELAGRLFARAKGNGQAVIEANATALKVLTSVPTGNGQKSPAPASA